MRTLVESILDIDAAISQEMPALNDLYSVHNITLSNGDWSTTHIARSFDWRKVQSYCKKQRYKYGHRWEVDGIFIDELVAIIEHVPVLGFEQNIVGVLRMFLKKGFMIELDENWKINSGKTRLTYIVFKPDSIDPQDRLEINIYLRKYK